jgi:hypothetical protein
MCVHHPCEWGEIVVDFFKSRFCNLKILLLSLVAVGAAHSSKKEKKKTHKRILHNAVCEGDWDSNFKIYSIRNFPVQTPEKILLLTQSFNHPKEISFCDVFVGKMCI